jgi:dTDP-4-amino-4,6-dideoxygalactose transaminase
MEDLRAEGIGCSVHFIPLHRHPYYQQQYGLHPSQFPIADMAFERLISLPLYSRMTDDDVDDVIMAIHSLIWEYGRS